MIDNKKILVIVPARGGSKGIKLKNIQKVGGVPLVARVGKLVKELNWIDRAVISTDHQTIAKIAKVSGLDVPFMRPEKISGDIISDWDVLNHALLEVEKFDNIIYDIIVMLQPTCPLRKPEHVTETVIKLIKGKYDAVWTVSETDSKAHPLKQLIIENDILKYYDPAGNNIIARQQLKPVYYRNGAAYAISRDCLVNKKSIKGERSSAIIIKDLLVNIDTQLDLDIANFIIKKLI